ncbi:transporter [Ruegeria meonggei]|uniref:transporter n=1 Tax=Ruegeria meonggei TaxID=1446476 RepID=UPI003670391F
MSRTAITFSIGLTLISGAAAAQSDDTAAEIAKDLANPFADLIVLPLILEYTPDIGSDDGYRTSLSFQPIYPFQLNSDLTLTVRTIIPLIQQENIVGSSGSQFGLGDIEQEFFLAPNAKQTRFGDLSLGAGLQVTWPTSTDSLLGEGTMALGPTAAALVQKNGWTYGGLITQQWGVWETRDNVPDVNTTFLEPFVAYTNASQWTFQTFAESEYDWTADEWWVPVTAEVGKLVEFGEVPVQIMGGVTYWADSPQGGPDGLAFRMDVSVVIPKGLKK